MVVIATGYIFVQYLEYAARDLAVAHVSNLTVYTGGWGVLQLDDINNNPVAIYLGLTEGKAVVPVPEVTWKVMECIIYLSLIYIFISMPDRLLVNKKTQNVI